VTTTEFDDIELKKPPSVSLNTAVTENSPGPKVHPAEQLVASPTEPVRVTVQVPIPSSLNHTVPVAAAGNPDSEKLAEVPAARVADEDPLMAMAKVVGCAVEPAGGGEIRGFTVKVTEFEELPPKKIPSVSLNIAMTK
jgi:hypothetical protein